MARRRPPCTVRADSDARLPSRNVYGRVIIP